MADPPVRVLGRKPGTNVFRPRSKEHPEDETFEGLLLLRFEGRLFFVNAERIGQKVRALVEESKPTVVALDLSGVFDLEYTALKMLTEAREEGPRPGRRALARRPQPAGSRRREPFRARRDASAARGCTSISRRPSGGSWTPEPEERGGGAMRALIRKTTSVWEREEGFTVLLALLVGNLFVAPLLKDAVPLPRRREHGALRPPLHRRGARRRAERLGGPRRLSSRGLRDRPRDGPPDPGTDPFAAWRVGAACLTIGLFAAVTLARVFAPGPVTSHRLVGAVVAYLLVGLTWAYAYDWLEIVRPGRSTRAEARRKASYPTLLYYSFVTLTTVGYGDVTPVSSAARALSNLESLVGVLYPAVLIGRLLSMQVTGAPPEPPAPG